MRKTIPTPGRLVKRAKRKHIKFPERVEGQPKIRNFLKAAWRVNPKFPKGDRITGTEAKKRKIGLVCEEDDKLEPSTRRPASKLRRKLSSCTETIELNSSSSSNINQYSNLKTTRPRKYVTSARFSNLDINCIQLKELQKTPFMKLSEKK